MDADVGATDAAGPPEPPEAAVVGGADCCWDAAGTLADGNGSRLPDSPAGGSPVNASLGAGASVEGSEDSAPAGETVGEEVSAADDAMAPTDVSEAARTTATTRKPNPLHETAA